METNSLSKNPIKLNFGNVNLSFEGLGNDKSKLEKISQQIFSLLNKKIQEHQSEFAINSEVTLDNISLQSIKISPSMNDQAIAERVASDLFEKIKIKLH